MNNENLNITNENNEENSTNQFNFQKKPEKNAYEQKEFDAKLIKSYIGTNHKKIITKDFSIPSLFFGGLYLIYRKMYIGIPIYFLFSVLTYFFTYNLVASIIVFVLQIIVNIIIATKFKKMYMNRAYDDCMKIQEKYGIRPDEDIIDLCKEQGGRSFFIVLILTIVLSSVSFALSSSLQYMFGIKKNNISPSLSTLEQTKIASTRDSAAGYIDQINKYMTLYSMQNNNNGDEIKIPENGTICTVTNETVYNDECADFLNSILFYGSQPTEASIKIDNGKVSYAKMVINGYNIEYDGNKTNVLS